jgi:hypothetical protein
MVEAAGWVRFAFCQSVMNAQLGEIAKRHKDEDAETIETQYICPHLWFLPNDEICKGMFDLLHIRLYKLFLR